MTEGAAGPPGGPSPARRRRRPRHLPRRTRVIVGVSTIGIIVVAGVIGGLARPTSSTNGLTSGGPPAPGFSLPSVTDPAATVRLQDFRGHPLVMNFFGSWCAPCRSELPFFADAVRTHPGIRFVGIDVEDSRPGAVAMMQQFGLAYPAGFDPNDRVATAYGIRGTPTTIFIDASGKIAKQYTGALTRPALTGLLRQLPSA